MRKRLPPRIQKIDQVAVVPTKPKYALFLGCHDRLTDLSCHLDIGAWTGLSVYTVFTGANPPLQDEPLRHWTNMPPLRSPNQGSGFCLVESIRWAAELGIPKILYRNSDDWKLNRKWVRTNLEKDIQFMGYNWLSCEADHEFAVDENIFDVKFWSQSLDLGWKSFLEERDVEHALGAWRKKIGATWRRHGLSRESSGGIGNYTADDDGWDSSRWFNVRWGLLGHHDLNRKRERYRQLRHHYHDSMGLVTHLEGLDELEKMPRFKRWLDGL